MVERLSAFATPADRRMAIALAAVAVIVFSMGFIIVYKFPIPIGVRVLIAGGIVLALWTIGTLPFSYNELTAEGLNLRQGWYFRASVPYANIASVEVVPAPGGIWGPGVRRESDGKGLRVVLSRQNLIQLKLKRPQSFKVFGVIPLVTAERVLLNVPEPEATIQTIRARINP